MHSKDYIHRVGRTARAGRAGKAISIVTQYDVEVYLRLEKTLDKKLEQWPTNKEEIALLRERVHEAGREATTKMKDAEQGKRKRAAWHGDDRDRDDDVVEAGMRIPKAVKKRRICEHHSAFRVTPHCTDVLCGIGYHYSSSYLWQYAAVMYALCTRCCIPGKRYIYFTS